MALNFREFVQRLRDRRWRAISNGPPHFPPMTGDVLEGGGYVPRVVSFVSPSLQMQVDICKLAEDGFSVRAIDAKNHYHLLVRFDGDGKPFPQGGEKAQELEKFLCLT